MGDTYFIEKLNCAYCGKENNFVKNEMFREMGLGWQFEFGGEFVCEFCKKKNKVKMEFEAVKIRKPSNKKSVRK